jgi:phage regulator Rha-like protein
MLMMSDMPSVNSKEIALMIGSRHDSVRRSIDTLKKKGIIKSTPTLEKVTFTNELGHNRSATAYVFRGDKGRHDTFAIVAKLSLQHIGEIIDVWMNRKKD